MSRGIKRYALLALFLTFAFFYYTGLGARRAPELQELPGWQRKSRLRRPKLESIPKIIWQTCADMPWKTYTPSTVDDSVLSWVKNSQGFHHILVSDTDAIRYVRKHYDTNSHARDIFLDIRIPTIRMDLFRYMVLQKEGGYFGDTDTLLIKSIRDWIPHRARKVRCVVGMEYDRMSNNPSQGFQERVSFIQWTFAAAAGHPIVAKAVERAVRNIVSFAAESNTTIANIHIPDAEVSRITGQSIWTIAVFEGLSEATGKYITYKEVTGLQAPKVFGDILVLPVNTFGTGQQHPYSNNATLVRHIPSYMREGKQIP